MLLSLCGDIFFSGTAIFAYFSTRFSTARTVSRVFCSERNSASSCPGVACMRSRSSIYCSSASRASSPNTNMSCLPPLRTMENSFEVKFMSSISMPTSSLIRMPVPRNRVRMAKSRACVFLWYAFCLLVNPSPFCTTSSRSATSFGSRRIMALSRIVGRSTRDGALCVSFSFL